MFLTLWQMGDYWHAINHIPLWLPAYTGLDRDETDWPKVLSESGFSGVAKRLLEVMNSTTKGYPLHYAKATLHAQLGEADLAVDVLTDSVETRSPNLAGLRMDGMLDPIRSFPRFAELLKSLGI
jgi:hypothetical protein